MNVLMLSNLFEPHIGGVEKHIENLVQELKKQGIKSTILTQKYSKQLKEQEYIEEIKIIRFSYPHIRFLGILYIWFWLLRNIKLIKEADLVHIHDVFIWYLPLRFLFPRKPVFITFHGYPSYPLSKKSVLYQKIAEKLTKGNICIGNFIGKWFKTKSSITSYGAVDLRKFKPRMRNKYQYDAVYSGRLDDQSGVLFYLDSIRILKKRGLNFKWLVLGDGKYIRSIVEFADCKGFVADPSTYFKQAKFAFAGGYLSILEALASKKLVFAVYNNPLKGDYLKMAPFAKWIIIENNSTKLADKIDYYLKNPNKARPLIEEAYEWVKNQTWEKMADNYLKLWGVK